MTAVLSVSIGPDELAYEYLPFFMNNRYQPEPAPELGRYLKKINAYLAESFLAGIEDRFAKVIDEKVNSGHRRNRIRMRVKMLGHFWDYLPYRKEIQAFRGSRKKSFP